MAAKQLAWPVKADAAGCDGVAPAINYRYTTCFGKEFNFMELNPAWLLTALISHFKFAIA